MAATAEEFHEILSQEVYVDVEKLRSMALHGCPAEVRADVWRYLLRVAVADLSQEEVNAKDRLEQFRQMQSQDYVEPIKRIHGDIQRYHPEIPLFSDPKVRKVFEQVVTTYLCQNPQQRYSAVLVHLAGPFVYVCHDQPADSFFMLEALAEQLELDDPKSDQFNRRLSDFGNFFRMLLPDLYTHFEDEELEMREWAHSWITSLLAVELPMECVLRLWDTYFSMNNGFDLHPYVCLAILQQHKEDLEESDHSEIVHTLTRLQPMDMDKIIAQARNLKQDIADRNIL